MDSALYANYLNILKQELVPALGCTEPIAIAYAAAKARQILGEFPDSVEILLSGNIIKNVKGVTVPNSGGRKGIETAVILGVIGGVAEKKLEVLTEIKQEHIDEMVKLKDAGYCSVELAEGVANLYICITAKHGNDIVKVEILDKHTNIINLEKNGVQVQGITGAFDHSETTKVRDFMTVSDILDFAEIVEIKRIEKAIESQIECNTKIAYEGVEKKYGVNYGKNLLQIYGNDVKIRARAMAASGSDARMCGSDLAVVINSGSGNQGLTVSLPVIEYAKELGCTKEKLYRALVISNLIALHIKSGIGSLSAFCGAVGAAAGSSAAITWLKGGIKSQVENAISNTLAIVSGIICDGAKASCAAKISTSVEAAIMSSELAINENNFSGGEGIVMDDIEDTIHNIGRLGKDGMKETDIEILNMMIGKKTG